MSSSQTSLVKTTTATVPGSHSTSTPQDLSTFPGGASGSDPPIPPHKSPTPNNSNSSSRDTSLDNMPSLRDKAVFFPSNTFNGKDKTLTRSHWQSFEDFL